MKGISGEVADFGPHAVLSGVGQALHGVNELLRLVEAMAVLFLT